MNKDAEEMLVHGAEQMGISLDAQAIKKFHAFTEILLKWNSVMNLTAITGEKEIVVKHYLDSLSILQCMHMMEGTSLVDVGCGAGFPGVPVKIVAPQIELTCIDSLGKRINFIDTALETIQLQAKTMHIRAEDAGRNQELREKFDYASARAVSRLNILAEYCLPLVKTGGHFIAMKAGETDAELDEAQHAVEMLGGVVQQVYKLNLPYYNLKRSVIVIRKDKTTPEIYPRNQARMKKQAL